MDHDTHNGLAQGLVPAEESDDEPCARHSYFLRTREDGSIVGDAETNDDLDQGVPTEWAQWQVRYRSYDDMRRQTGLTHVGCNGCRVQVYLDGKQI